MNVCCKKRALLSQGAFELKSLREVIVMIYLLLRLWQNVFN